MNLLEVAIKHGAERRICKKTGGMMQERNVKAVEGEAEVCGPTTGSEDDRPLGGGHERLDGGEETRVVVKNDVDFFEEDERGGRLLALLLAALLLGGGRCW